MSESIEEIAKKEDPKILPHITGSKPASTNLLKINKRAQRTTRSSWKKDKGSPPLRYTWGSIPN